MATNLRIKEVNEGDLLEVDGKRRRVSCALILDDDVIIVLDDEGGEPLTLTSAEGAVRLIARPAAKNTLAGDAPSIISGL